VARWWLGGGEGDDVDPAAHAELGQDVGDVGFDGAARQAQLVGDLGVGSALGDEVRDAGFAASEAVPADSGALASGVRMGAQAVGAELDAGAVQVPGGAEVLI
jgi:hypothetical protein